MRLALAALVTLLLAGCSGEAAPGPDRPSVAPPAGHGYRPAAPRAFVPQGVAVDRGRIFVTGYRWTRRIGLKYCQVIVVDRATGRTTGRALRLTDTGIPLQPICRHGGGAGLGEDGLWVAGAGRLWLLDPDRPADVRRSWAVDDDILASTMTIDGADLLLGRFRNEGASKVLRFGIADLLAPGVERLSLHAAAGSLVPGDVRPGPSHLQGIAVAGGVWKTRSGSFCGELVTPGGRRLAFVPGAEGIDFDGRWVWVVSESGSPTYQAKGGRPDTPMVTRISRRRLAHLPGGRCF